MFTYLTNSKDKSSNVLNDVESTILVFRPGIGDENGLITVIHRGITIAEIDMGPYQLVRPDHDAAIIGKKTIWKIA